MFEDPIAGAQVPGRVRVKDRTDAAKGCKERPRRDHAKREQPPGASRRCRRLAGGTGFCDGHVVENGWDRPWRLPRRDLFAARG